MASKVLKSDMETAICSRQPRIDGNDTGPTARVTEAITHWLARAKNKPTVANPAGLPAGQHRAGNHHVTGLPVLAADLFPVARNARAVDRSDGGWRDATRLYQRGESGG